MTTQGTETKEEAAAQEPFGPVIFSYTRAQAIADGALVDLHQHPTPEQPDLDDLRAMVLEAGFKPELHVAMTATAFADAVCPIGGDLPAGQSIAGRLWDVLMVLRFTIGRGNTDRVHFKVCVYDGRDATGRQRRRVVRLWALIGPGDEGKPVLTIMLEGEE